MALATLDDEGLYAETDFDLTGNYGLLEKTKEHAPKRRGAGIRDAVER